MGLFATRPEEPFEWAGIPSEPEKDDTAAERLGAASVTSVSAVDGIGLAAADSLSIDSLSIEVTLPPTDPQTSAG